MVKNWQRIDIVFSPLRVLRRRTDLLQLKVKFRLQQTGFEFFVV